MEQRTPIPLRRISVATNFIARSNDPSRAYCPPSGGAGFRVEQGTGLATCGGSKRRNFRAGSKPPVRALTARRLGKLSICYATHSLLCDALLQPHGTFGKCPRNEGISDHASRMSQVIPTPASLRGASCFGCNKQPAVPVLDRKARNAAMARTSLQLSSQASANKRRL
jgi:hypothetical protein